MVQFFKINQHAFIGILNLKDYAVRNNISSKRDLETQGKIYLLQQMFDDSIELVYDEKGKPHLNNDPHHISISHSHDQLAIIANKEEATGIDIELIRDKVLKIKHKYLTQSELLDANDDVEKLLIYWAAKETLYKIYGLKEVDFIAHLFVKPFIKHNLGTIIGIISMPDFMDSFELNYKIIDNYVLVYSLNRIK